MSENSPIFIEFIQYETDNPDLPLKSGHIGYLQINTIQYILKYPDHLIIGLISGERLRVDEVCLETVRNFLWSSGKKEPS